MPLSLSYNRPGLCDSLRDKQHSSDARFDTRLQASVPVGLARLVLVLSERVAASGADASFWATAGASGLARALSLFALCGSVNRGWVGRSLVAHCDSQGWGFAHARFGSRATVLVRSLLQAVARRADPSGVGLGRGRWHARFELRGYCA